MSVAAVLSALLITAEVNFPAVLDERLKLELVASEPDVVTPTGIAVDGKGRVLVIESQTHFRPKDYEGPAADRILMLEDFDPASGKARKRSVFFEGTTHTMSLAVFYDGSVYVATRMEIFRLRDRDGDGRAEERTPICHLETKGNYPHNGLSGFAFDFAGNVFFGFGENLGAPYELIGSDGKSLRGGGEGGNIYACDSEGRNLCRVATGFWNPFHLCFDAFGRLFAVDNDPDSRPPCRLLHVVEGGDYGFKFRNGRKGVHPFTAWNGELPGTLPMVSGTGEAPCAVMAYESDNLPAEYRGDLLVTSWGDHRLERYRLTPRGASFAATMTPVVRGDQNFRPVGLAMAPDGSLFFSDWVDKSYPLHGKGRVWRLSAKEPAKPSRPEDTIEALSSPHGPWREAAAKRLATDPAVKLAADSKSERVRSLAGRAAITSDRRWSQFVEKLPPEDRPKGANYFAGVLGFAEAMARLRPESVADAFKAEDCFLRFVNGDELSKEEQTWGMEWVMDWRRGVRRLPAELQPASIQLFAGPLVEIADDVSSDPFLVNAWLNVATGSTQTGERDAFDGFSKIGPLLRILFRPKRPRTLQDVFADTLNKSLTAGQVFALALRRADTVESRQVIPDLLQSKDVMIRLIGIVWVGEARLEKHRSEIEKLLHASGNNRQLFECGLAALDLLAGNRPADPKKETPGEEFIARIVKDSTAPVDLRRFAIRSLRPDHSLLTPDVLSKLIRDSDSNIRLEAIRTMRERAYHAWPELQQIAADATQDVQLRCEAILGLSPENADDRLILLHLAAVKEREVAAEAGRALRGQTLSDVEKASVKLPAAEVLTSRLLGRKDDELWQQLAQGDGDSAAGERVFFSRLGMCSRCHEHEGRGARVGPDLSTIGKSMTRERLLQSIVDPSREVAPQFTSFTILKHDGTLLTGMHVGDEIDGRMRFLDATGREFHVHPNEIDRREPSQKSIMPEGVVNNLTAQELRDLLAFLLKSN